MPIPPRNISLRSASPANVVLHTEDEDGPRTIGEVDLASAVWMVHPRAVYLHEGQQYFVQDLDLTRNIADAHPRRPRLLHRASARNHHPNFICYRDQAIVRGGDKTWGELLVTTQVTGFRKRSWLGGENLGDEPLDLPPSDLQTTGYWLSLSEETISHLRETGAWSNDPNDYGPDWPKIRDRVRARDGFRCQVCGLPENGPLTEPGQAVSMMCITKPLSGNFPPPNKPTASTTSSLSAPPAIARRSKTSACEAGWPDSATC